MLRINPRAIVHPPFDAVHLEAYVEHLRSVFLRDESQTAAWLLEKRTAKALREAVQDAWRSSHLPLRGWVDSVTNVHGYCDSQLGVLSILVQTTRHGHRSLLQQAPLPRTLCIQRLTQQIGRAPGELVDMFGVAPGLVCEADIVIAAPDFLLNPMKTVVTARVGPEWSVEDCLNSDIAVFEPDRCAFELLWDRNGLRQDFVVVGRDGHPYLYIGDMFDALTELDASAEEVLYRAIEHPQCLLLDYVPRVRANGAKIGFKRAGDEARVVYSSLDLRDKVAVALTVLIAIARGGDNSQVWRDVRNVLQSCRDSVMNDIAIRSDTQLLAHGLSCNSKWIRERRCHKWVEPVTFVPFISELISAWNTGSDLRYPDLRLHPNVAQTPIYRRVVDAAQQLRREREAAPRVAAELARTRLLARFVP